MVRWFGSHIVALCSGTPPAAAAMDRAWTPPPGCFFPAERSAWIPSPVLTADVAHVDMRHNIGLQEPIRIQSS